MSDFEALGGETVLRSIITDFVGRCFDDMMIGFLFAKASRERVTRFEYQHAAEHLGGDVVYEGRAIRDAHRAHRIMGGQFDRRRTILTQTLSAHGVPEDIATRWLKTQEALRPMVTSDASGECIG